METPGWQHLVFFEEAVCCGAVCNVNDQVVQGRVSQFGPVSTLVRFNFYVNMTGILYAADMRHIVTLMTLDSKDII